MKKALITGITGQDGAYLAAFLLKNNYQVFGSYRRSSSSNFWRLDYLKVSNHKNLSLIECDLNDQGSVLNCVKKIIPDEIYNLAAQSYVAVSFDQPYLTSMTTGLGALNILEAIRHTNKNIKFYQASSSEMFGKVLETPQNEKTPFYPRSPYGVAKVYAHWMTINYRESYDIFASNGILFNHESPIRGLEFVTRKITDSIAKIKLGLLDCLEIGNMDSKRDWGYAYDYVEGMYKILQHEKADNYVLATNKTETVRNFLTYTLDTLDFNYVFEGKNENEVCINKDNNKVICKVNKSFYRPSEVDLLKGDYSKAKKELNWEPRTDLKKLVEIMTDADYQRNKSGTVY
jgi:GDPmannose 4,6-dehydratase